MNVLTLGTFDLFHRGHVELLKECRRLAGKHGSVKVLVNTDEFVARFKGRPPVVSLTDRKAVVAACRYAGDVMDNPQGENLPSNFYTVQNHIRDADLIVIGSDWRDRDYLSQIEVTQDFLDEHHVLLVYVPYTEGISSTAIRERIA